MDLRALFQRSAVFHADRVALVDGGREYTFDECWLRGVRLANLLETRGARQGDRVASLEGNTIRAVDVMIACAVGAFVRVPLYARDSRSGQVAMMHSSSARVLIIDESDQELLTLARGEGIRIEVAYVREAGYENELLKSSAELPPRSIDESDLCIIRHTSGTTGHPKGVPNTHRQWLSLSRDAVSFIPPPQPGDRFVHVAPMTHASGYFFPMMWAAGVCQVMSPSAKPHDVLSALRVWDADYTFMPPPILNPIVREAESTGEPIPVLKALLIGSAPMSTELTVRTAAVFGTECMHQIYGVSEAVTPVAMGPREWFAELAGSDPMLAIGRPLPTAEVEVRDGENCPLPIGEIGELAIRCDGQMSAYFGDSERVRSQSAERIVNGWIMTGDIARIDQNGYVYLLDRKSDLIISGGFNIYPGELERVISDHDDVLEVAVFGVPHEKWGETPWAVCQVRSGSAVDEAEIVALVRKRLGSMRKPTRVWFIDEPLPKSPVGKIQRRELRTRFFDANAGEGSRS